MEIITVTALLIHAGMTYYAITELQEQIRENRKLIGHTFRNRRIGEEEEKHAREKVLESNDDVTHRLEQLNDVLLRYLSRERQNRHG